jgi:O-antigen/teichoic acid export membrane protein
MSNTTIAKNAAAMMVSDVGVRAFSALGALLVVRSLGPRAYGVLSVGLAFSAIVSYLSDIGITGLTIQQITKPNVDIGCVLGTVLRVRLALVAVVALVSWFVILLAYRVPEQRFVMVAVVLPSIGGTAMQGFAASYFWATQEMHITAGLKIFSQVFAAIALFLAFFFRWPVRGVAVIYGIASLLGGIACLLLVSKRAPKMRGWDPQFLKGLTSFTIGGVTGIALPQLGPLILQRVAAATEVGFFAAASRIPVLLYAIPSCLDTAWYPQLFHAGSRDSAKHFALSVNQLMINSIVGVGLSLPVALYSHVIIRTVLGPSWEASTAPILSLLCWMVALNSLTTPFADALTTKGMQNRRAGVYAASLVVGAFLFVGLGSARGALGAAAAAIATQVMLSIGLILVNPSGGALLLAGIQRLFRPTVLGTAGAFGIYALLPNMLFSVPVCSATFFLLAAAADKELRSGAMKLVEIVQSKCRYALSTT